MADTNSLQFTLSFKPNQHRINRRKLVTLHGDIALYVTNSTTSDGEDFDAEEIEVDYFGSRITYIPASSIRRVDLRHSSPIPSSGERAQALQGEGAP